MKHLFITLLFAAIAICASAKSSSNAAAPAENRAAVESAEQLHTYTMTVTDAVTHEALAGVLVNVGGKKYYTDFNGRISISSVSGNAEATVSFISYRDTKVTLNSENTTLQLQQL